MRKQIYIGISLLVITAFFTLGAIFGYKQAEVDMNQYDEYKVYLDIIEQLNEDHYMQPTIEELLQYSIEGMIVELGDPHTTYFDQQEAEEFNASLGETYVGIGVRVEVIDDLIFVLEVFDNSPALEAGIQPGDNIAFVEYEDIRGDNLYDVIGKIVGDEGTKVVVGIIRDGISEPIHFEMTRSVIENSTIEEKVIIEDGKKVGYIKINSFGSETATKFNVALNNLRNSNVEGLIIDVRNNGGGYLGAVLNIMQLFLVENDLPIFQTVDYTGNKENITKYYGALEEAYDLNIVVLVNGGSASASEVFAAGMSEHGGYQIVGLTTYGKGTMQIDRSLSNTEGDKLHISIGKWLTPESNWVHFNGGSDGITPDIKVEYSDLQKAYKVFLQDDEIIEYDTVDSRLVNIQLVLNEFYGKELRIDGYFDHNTLEAINELQTSLGLEVTTYIDQSICSVINEHLYTVQISDDYDAILQEGLDALFND